MSSGISANLIPRRIIEWGRRVVDLRIGVSFFGCYRAPARPSGFSNDVGLNFHSRDPTHARRDAARHDIIADCGFDRKEKIAGVPVSTTGCRERTKFKMPFAGGLP